MSEQQREQLSGVQPEQQPDARREELSGVRREELSDVQPADVHEVTDPRIAAAVARLDSLEEKLPVEHVEVYEEIHRVLQESLAEAAHSSSGRSGSTGADERTGEPRS